MDLALYHPWIHTKGGAEKVILKTLEKSQHNITVYTTKYRPEQTYPELQDYEIKEVKGLPIKGYLFRGLSFTIANLTTKLPMEQYDALVVSTAGVAEIINYRNHEKPIIGYCHTPLRAARDPEIYQQNIEEKGLLTGKFYQLAVKIYKTIEKPAWKYFDHVQFNSENTRQRALTPGLIDKEKTSINHPGTSTEDKFPGEYKQYFFLPGRIAPYKRLELAIDAFEKFQEWNPQKDFKLIIAGSTQDEKSEYLEKIREKIKDNEKIELKTNVNSQEWEELYKDCYATLFTARNEDWGITPIEANAYGKPVISVDEGGPRESIKHKETGLLVESQPVAIAEAMNKLVKQPDLVKKLGKTGLQHAEKFTWDKFIQKFDVTITDTVEQKNKEEKRKKDKQ